ncbi:MAG: PH domain-containing protein [Candidatus Absconditicoccaceae bacterium]
MLRKEIIKQYVDVDNIHHVIGHNGSILIREVLKTLLFLFVLYLIYLGISQYSDWTYWSWLFAGIGIYFFIKFVINFLNLYLDALILSDRGITLFMREGIWDYKTDIFERDKIETISFNQNSLIDKIFGKGDIIIKLEHGVDFPFDNISGPKRQVGKIMRMKDYFVGQKKDQDLKDLKGEENKFNILVEALGEVVQEYMEKGKKNPDLDNNY